jgi:hypothetical protein
VEEEDRDERQRSRDQKIVLPNQPITHLTSYCSEAARGIGLQDSGRRGVVHINPTPLWAIALHELRLTPIEKVRHQRYYLFACKARRR